MKFQPDTPSADFNYILRHDADGLLVHSNAQRQRINTSIIVPWQGACQPWLATGFDELTPEHFDHLLPYQPELVLLGTGAKVRFVVPRLYRSLIDARIGLESMDNAAACRTYNVLVSEGRKVLLAWLAPTPP